MALEFVHLFLRNRKSEFHFVWSEDDPEFAPGRNLYWDRTGSSFPGGVALNEGTFELIAHNIVPLYLNFAVTGRAANFYHRSGRCKVALPVQNVVRWVRETGGSFGTASSSAVLSVASCRGGGGRSRGIRGDGIAVDVKVLIDDRAAALHESVFMNGIIASRDLRDSSHVDRVHRKFGAALVIVSLACSLAARTDPDPLRVIPGKSSRMRSLPSSFFIREGRRRFLEFALPGAFICKEHVLRELLCDGAAAEFSLAAGLVRFGRLPRWARTSKPGWK